MSNILSEISRVREIMGVINEQDITATTVTAPSEEILAWAESQISWRQAVIETGVEQDGYDQGDLDGYAADILRLQQDPVRVVQEDKDKLCGWVEDGDNDWVDQCEEMTELLATLQPKKPQIAAAVPIKGCTDEDAPNYDPKAIIDDGSCKEHSDKTPKKSIKKLKRGLKDKWKKEVFKILKGIKEGDIFGFDKVYDLQESDKLHALLTMLQNLMCVNAKIARTVILAQDNVYDPTKLMTIAQFPKGGGHEGLIETIFTNIELLDKRFKLGGGGMKVDRKLRPIKSQLNRAKDFINTIEPYLNWGGVEDSLGFRATSTEDILINSSNLNQIHRDCANQIK